MMNQEQQDGLLRQVQDMADHQGQLHRDLLVLTVEVEQLRDSLEKLKHAITK